MPNPRKRQGNKKYVWKTHPNFNTARAGAKTTGLLLLWHTGLQVCRHTHPPTKAGSKHTAQAHLPAHQTKRKSLLLKTFLLKSSSEVITS